MRLRFGILIVDEKSSINRDYVKFEMKEIY